MIATFEFVKLAMCVVSRINYLIRYLLFELCIVTLMDFILTMIISWITTIKTLHIRNGKIISCFLS